MPVSKSGGNGREEQSRLSSGDTGGCCLGDWRLFHRAVHFAVHSVPLPIANTISYANSQLLIDQRIPDPFVDNAQRKKSEVAFRSMYLHSWASGLRPQIPGVLIVSQNFVRLIRVHRQDHVLYDNIKR